MGDPNDDGVCDGENEETYPPPESYDAAAWNSSKRHVACFFFHLWFCILYWWLGKDAERHMIFTIETLVVRVYCWRYKRARAWILLCEFTWLNGINSLRVDGACRHEQVSLKNCVDMAYMRWRKSKRKKGKTKVHWTVFSTHFQPT